MRRPKNAKELENMVADALRDAGYNVTQNLRTTGQQIDVIAEHIDPIQGHRRIAIECKYRTSSLVSNQDVFDWIAMFNAIHERERFHVGLLITNTGVTADGKKALDANHRIRALTFDELSRVTQDPRRRLPYIVKEYERDQLFSSYVPLSAEGSSARYDRIESEILSWIHEQRYKLVSVVGDFGAGKTTLLRRLRYRLAQKSLEKRTAPVPLLISLKDFGKAGSIEALINLEGERSLGVSSFFQFMTASSKGDYVLLLDGLDEMAPPTGDHNDGLRALIAVWPAIASGHTCVLSCRPAYFMTADDYNAALATLQDRSVGLQPKHAGNRPTAFSKHQWADIETVRDNRAALARHLHQILIAKDVPALKAHPLTPETCTSVTLAGFTPAQIDAYLRKHDSQLTQKAGANWEAVKEDLYKIYDLRDLMRRPLLLSMILETVLVGAVNLRDKRQALGPFQLYEVYTSHKLQIEDHDKGRAKLEIDERRALSEAIALAMLAAGQLEVVHGQILSAMQQATETHQAVRDKAQRMAVAELAADARLCGFIIPTDDGKYRFSHKSFMEFFVARNIANRLSRHDANGLKGALPAEVRFFLGSYLEMVPEAWTLISEALDDPDESIRSTAAAIAFNGPHVPSLTIHDVLMARETFARLKMKGGSLKGARFRSCLLESVVLEELALADVAFEESTIRSVNIERNGPTTVEMDRSEIGAVTAKASSINVVGTGTIGHINMVGGRLELRGAISFARLDCTSLAMLLANETLQNALRVVECDSHLTGGMLRESVFEGGTVLLEGTRIRDCSLQNVAIDVPTEATPTTFDKTKFSGATLNTQNAVFVACAFKDSKVTSDSGRLRDVQFETSHVLLSDGDAERTVATSCNITLSRMRVTGIDVSECDVKFAAGEGRRAIVDGGRLEIDKTSVISDSSFRSCVVFGSGVAQRSNIEGECTWRGCRLEGATVRKATVTLEACQCVDLEVHGGSIALKAQAHVSRLVVTDGTVSIEKGAILDESEITNARVDIFGGSLAGDVRLKHARVFGRTVQRSDLTVASEGVATGLFMIRDSRDGFMFERKDTPAGVLIFTVLMESERLLDRLQRRLEKEVSSERLPDFMQYIDRSREFIRSGQKVDGGGKDAISRLRKRGDINRRES